MKRLITTVALCLLISAVVSAQAPATPTPTPTVGQVLDKYVAALGGTAALEKLNSRAAKGAIEFPDQGAVGTIEIHAKAPNLVFTLIEVEGFGSIRNAWDGTAGWTDNPQAGLNDYSPAETANAKLNNFHLPLKFRELYAKLAVKGAEKVANRDVWVVEAVPTAGSPRLFSFDAESGLLVRTVVEIETPAGVAKIETYFSNYKNIDEIKLPFTSRRVSPQFTSVVTISEVKHNVPIDDAKFKKPM